METQSRGFYAVLLLYPGKARNTGDQVSLFAFIDQSIAFSFTFSRSKPELLAVATQRSSSDAPYNLNKVLKKRGSDRPLSATRRKPCIYAACQTKKIGVEMRSHLIKVHSLSVAEVENMGNLDNHPTIDTHLVCHLTPCSRSHVAFSSLKGLRAHYTKSHKDKQQSLSQEEVEAKIDEAVQKHIYAKPQSSSSTPGLAPLSSFDRNISYTNNPSAEKRRRRRAPLKQVDPQVFAEMNATLTKAHRTWRQKKLGLDEDQAVVQQSGSQSSCDDQEYSEFEGCSD